MDPKIHAAVVRASLRNRKSVNQLINQYIREGLESDQKRGERFIRTLDGLPRIPAQARITRRDAYAWK
jgi:adenylate kinase family enzyme